MRLRSLALATLMAVSPLAVQAADPFSFIAIGDMPYKLPDDYAKVDRLIAQINAEKPAVTLHVGDVKSGSSQCSDEVLTKAYEQLQTIDGALVYSIGDNEWTDCHRKDAGAFDPRERLKKVREIYFAKPEQSLGKTPIAVESQGKIMPDFATYVENTRFVKNEVLFAGVHMPGSNNGFEAIDPVASATEFAARDKANVVWINDAFKMASEKNMKAVVLFFQADFDVYRDNKGELNRQDGYYRAVAAIEAGAKTFGKPVLLVHGDEHYFKVGPFLNVKGKQVPNVTKLMVWGEGEIHGIRIHVNTNDPAVFSFGSLIIPDNVKK